MSGLANSLNEVLCDAARSDDFAKRPERQWQIRHRGEARVLSEMQREVPIAYRIEQRQRFLQMTAPPFEIAHVPFRHAAHAVRWSGQLFFRPAVEIAQERIRS